MTIESVNWGPYAAGPYATQPWNRVVWPGPWPMSASNAISLPSVGRALALISGQIRQCPLDDYRGVTPLTRPRLLDAPDPAQARSWFVGQEVNDYLLHGNALSYVTAYDAQGYPAAASWLPAEWVHIAWNPGDPDYSRPTYWVGGRELDASRVVHVKRGADERWPVRGVGVVEQHLSALTNVQATERYSAESLSGNGVPSVAVVTPNPRLSQTEADAAKVSWMEKFNGPVREPAILPAGTQVIPLAWSATDAQLNETRVMNLQDVANMFNLDGYYLGAEATSMTYRSPGPMSLQLLRTTLEPIMADFEGVWSAAWLPHGRTVRFDRNRLLTDDMANTVATLQRAVAAGLMTLAEARIYMGLPALPEGHAATMTSPVATTEGEAPVGAPVEPEPVAS